MTDAPRPRDVRLQPQIVVFLDLLGFRAKMAQAARDAGRAADLLAQYDAVMADAFEVLDGHHGMFQYKGFTDNIVISSPLRDRFHPEERFGVVTNAVADFQLILAREGWFIRGGIAVGDFYMDERIVFGPALVEAYQLEQTAAMYPRVVLSDTAKHWMRSFLEFYSDKAASPQNVDVLIDVDGRAYINYLAANYMWGAPEAARDDLEAHKRRVEAALVDSRPDAAIWTKYRWAAQYHDHFARVAFGDAARDLLISTEALRAGPTDLAAEQLPPGFPIPWEGTWPDE